MERCSKTSRAFPWSGFVRFHLQTARCDHLFQPFDYQQFPSFVLFEGDLVIKVTRLKRDFISIDSLLLLLAKYNGFVETCKLPFLSLIYKSFLFAFALEWDRLYVRLNADLLISDIQHRMLAYNRFILSNKVLNMERERLRVFALLNRVFEPVCHFL